MPQLHSFRDSEHCVATRSQLSHTQTSLTSMAGACGSGASPAPSGELASCSAAAGAQSQPAAARPCAVRANRREAAVPKVAPHRVHARIAAAATLARCHGCTPRSTGCGCAYDITPFIDVASCEGMPARRGPAGSCPEYAAVGVSCSDTAVHALRKPCKRMLCSPICGLSTPWSPAIRDLSPGYTSRSSSAGGFGEHLGVSESTWEGSKSAATADGILPE